MSSRWNKTHFKGATSKAKINRETGVITDVVMCQAGEAKGHGVHLDQEFIESVVSLAAAHTQGMKARFGHPSMSDEALGKALGRFHNPRLRGSQAIGDLHLANYAKNSPEGDLHSYIIDRAIEDPNSFGSSIVFQPGKTYQRNQSGEKIYQRLEDGERNPDWDPAAKKYIEIQELHNCDLVDEGAATDSLFHAKYNSHAFAVRLTHFLDQNPDIDTFLDEHEDVEKKIHEFIEKRKALKLARVELSSTEQKLDMSNITTEQDKLSLNDRINTMWEKLFGAKKEEAEPAADSEVIEASGQDDLIKALKEENQTLRQQLQEKEAADTAIETRLAEMEEEIKKLGNAPAAELAPEVPNQDIALQEKGGDALLEETEEAIKRFERRKKYA